MPIIPECCSGRRGETWRVLRCCRIEVYLELGAAATGRRMRAVVVEAEKMGFVEEEMAARVAASRAILNEKM